METGASEPTPDLDDLFQEEVQVVSVPVRGEGSFLTHELPARRAQMKADLVPQGSWTPLLPATDKRKQVVLLSVDNAFYLSTNGTGTSGFLWPANVPLVLTHTQRIFAWSANAAGSNISHVSEFWAD